MDLTDRVPYWVWVWLIWLSCAFFWNVKPDKLKENKDRWRLEVMIYLGESKENIRTERRNERWGKFLSWTSVDIYCMCGYGWYNLACIIDYQPWLVSCTTSISRYSNNKTWIGCCCYCALQSLEHWVWQGLRLCLETHSYF